MAGRTLYHASAVLQVLDDWTRQPVYARVSCLTYPKQAIRSRSGYWIFCDLPAGEHTFLVSSAGYLSHTLSLQLDSRHCQERSIALYYDRTAPTLGHIPHIVFSCKSNSAVLADCDCMLRLENPTPLLRTVEEIPKGGRIAALGGQGRTRFLLRAYETEAGPTLQLESGHIDGIRYMLAQPAPCKLPKGTQLKPRWPLHTDSQGTLVFPLDYLFIRGQARLTLEIDGCKAEASIPQAAPSGQTITVEFCT